MFIINNNIIYKYFRNIINNIINKCFRSNDSLITRGTLQKSTTKRLAFSLSLRFASRITRRWLSKEAHSSNSFYKYSIVLTLLIRWDEIVTYYVVCLPIWLYVLRIKEILIWPVFFSILLKTNFILVMT